jgi:hypothetical protein
MTALLLARYLLLACLTAIVAACVWVEVTGRE